MIIAPNSIIKNDTGWEGKWGYFYVGKWDVNFALRSQATLSRKPTSVRVFKLTERWSLKLCLHRVIGIGAIISPGIAYGFDLSPFGIRIHRSGETHTIG